jgi:hypothetical protein
LRSDVYDASVRVLQDDAALAGLAGDLETLDASAAPALGDRRAVESGFVEPEAAARTLFSVARR